jgi:hypothetical protein
MTVARTRGISTKVTEDEYRLLEARAGGTTVSEWARDVLLKAATAPPEGPVILAELLALRSLVLNLLYKLSTGIPITAEEMERLIHRADAEKASKAQTRLAAGLEGASR